MSRRQPNLTELLGTALLQLFPDVMTFEEARALTPKQVIARVRKSYDVHHWTYVAVLGGDNHPANMSWMASAAHDERTRKIDVPTIAKLKRGAKKRAAELIAPTHAPSSDKPKGRKLQGRGFQKPPPGTKHNWKTGRRERVQ
jgi:hypothetical protein